MSIQRMIWCNFMMIYELFSFTWIHLRVITIRLYYKFCVFQHCTNIYEPTWLPMATIIKFYIFFFVEKDEPTSVWWDSFVVFRFYEFSPDQMFVCFIEQLKKFEKIPFKIMIMTLCTRSIEMNSNLQFLQQIIQNKIS